MASFNGAASCTPGTGGTPGRLIILLTELLAELDFELKCIWPEIFLEGLMLNNLSKIMIVEMVYILYRLIFLKYLCNLLGFLCVNEELKE